MIFLLRWVANQRADAVPLVIRKRHAVACLTGDVFEVVDPQLNIFLALCSRKLNNRRCPTKM
jgi:hypothetical protein